MRWSDLDGRRVVVWGYGREGRAAVAECRRRGVEVTVAVDGNVSPEADEPILAGEAGVRTLREADVVLKSPGVPVATELYRSVAAGAEITSLSDLWLSDHAHRAIGITGTKGKSTTASLLHHLLTAVGEETTLVGNIGAGFSGDTGEGTAVAELSSYQTQPLTFSPRIAVVTSLFPEHLTWHGTPEQYFDDKLNLVAHGPTAVVWPGDDLRLSRLIAERVPPAALHPVAADDLEVGEDGSVTFTHAGFTVPRVPLVGRHNLMNLALAVRVLGLLGHLADPHRIERVAAAIAEFRPLEHRLEPVPSGDGRIWIDDGLATAPEAVVAALSGLGEERVAVIVGGADRGLDYRPLLEYVAGTPGRVRLLLIGPAGRRIAEATEAAGVPHLLFDGLAGATDWASGPENDAGTVLLSPGAPSFDEFTDYTERAAAFRAAAAAARRVPG